MRSPMQIWRHLLGVMVSCALFVAGKLMVAGGHRLAGALAQRAVSSGVVSKFFVTAGKFFEVVAVVGAFVETVAVMVLASGWLIYFFWAFGGAE